MVGWARYGGACKAVAWWRVAALVGSWGLCSPQQRQAGGSEMLQAGHNSGSTNSSAHRPHTWLMASMVRVPPRYSKLPMPPTKAAAGSSGGRPPPAR